jgi:hypothetical protein
LSKSVGHRRLRVVCGAALAPGAMLPASAAATPPDERGDQRSRNFDSRLFACGLRGGQWRMLVPRDLERIGEPAADLKLDHPLGDHPDREHGAHPAR